MKPFRILSNWLKSTERADSVRRQKDMQDTRRELGRQITILNGKLADAASGKKAHAPD